MHVLNIDMYQTLAFAVGVLFIGGFLKKKISILENSVFLRRSSAD